MTQRLAQPRRDHMVQHGVLEDVNVRALPRTGVQDTSEEDGLLLPG
jgi:hypothetical protein